MPPLNSPVIRLSKDFTATEMDNITWSLLALIPTSNSSTMSTSGSLNPETVALIAVVIIIAVTALSLLMIALYLCRHAGGNRRNHMGSKCCCSWKWRRERRSNEDDERSLTTSICLSHRPSTLVSSYDTDDIPKEKSDCEPVEVHIPTASTTTATLSNIAEKIAADDSQRSYGHKDQCERKDLESSNNKSRNITSTTSTKNSKTVDSLMRASDNFLKPKDNMYSPVGSTSSGYFSDMSCPNTMNDSQGIYCTEFIRSDSGDGSKSGEQMRSVMEHPGDTITGAHDATSHAFLSAVPPYIDVTDPLGETHRVISSPCQNETVINANTIDISPNGEKRQQGLGITSSEECLHHKFMTPISTLTNITSEGITFTDKTNDFSMEIPEGAIPEGVRLTIDMGVALFGPFQFPEGLRPVSPVFWVCVRDQKNFEFSKPVTVTIPHFLELENDDDIQSLGLTFLKAYHDTNVEQMYQFRKTDGKMTFVLRKRFGLLQITHFCSLCIACRDSPECLEKTTFCITAVLPNSTIPVGRKIYAYFFVTFLNLKTCLRRVDELISQKNLKEYEKIREEFKFEMEKTSDPALEIDITQPKHGKIGVRGKKKVCSLCEHKIADCSITFST